MIGPDVIVIGASRSGTTTLHRWLADHPQVHAAPEKSPNHFATGIPMPPWESATARAMAARWVHDPTAYQALFADAPAGRVRVEVSPVYLQSTRIPERIATALPDVRLVAILREPVARARAHYLGRRRDGIEPESSFTRRIDRELAAPLPGETAFGHYLGCGQYATFLSAYDARFDPASLRVYLYDDLVADPAGLAADLFTFVGVDPTHTPDLSLRLNRSGQVRNPVARAVWTRSVGVRTRLRPMLPARLRDRVGRRFLADLAEDAPLDPTLATRMRDALATEVDALEARLARDLSSWRSS